MTFYCSASRLLLLGLLLTVDSSTEKKTPKHYSKDRATTPGTKTPGVCCTDQDSIKERITSRTETQTYIAYKQEKFKVQCSHSKRCTSYRLKSSVKTQKVKIYEKKVHRQHCKKLDCCQGYIKSDDTCYKMVEPRRVIGLEADYSVNCSRLEANEAIAYPIIDAQLIIYSNSLRYLCSDCELPANRDLPYLICSGKILKAIWHTKTELDYRNPVIPPSKLKLLTSDIRRVLHDLEKVGITLQLTVITENQLRAEPYKSLDYDFTLRPVVTSECTDISMVYHKSYDACLSVDATNSN